MNKKRIIQITALLVAICLVVAGISIYRNQKTQEAQEEAETETASSNYSCRAGMTNLITVNVQEVEVSEAVYNEEQQNAMSAASAENYGYTNLGVANCEGNLNVRKTPATDGEIVGKMPEHGACEILDSDGQWVHIKSGKVEGYVAAEYLATGEEAKALADQNATLIATVNTQTLRMRSQPDINSSIVTLIPEGEELEVLEDDGEWLKVCVDNDEGYINAEYVDQSVELPHASTVEELKKTSGVSDTRTALVNYALQFVGNPYVWGGTSLTKGADCSGFVLSVYAHFGVSLPHSSKAQANCGTRIKSSQAQPGDLFFYGSGKTISHVAIYIGNGMIVHASNRKTGIKTSSAYYRTPICVVRLLS